MEEGPSKFREMLGSKTLLRVFFLSHEIIFCHELNGNIFVHGGQARLNVTRVTKYVYTISSIKTVIIQWDFFFFARTFRKDVSIRV